MTRTHLLAFSLLFLVQSIAAQSQDYGPRTFYQPDGTRFTAHKFADELGRFLLAAGGFIQQDPMDGYY